MTPSKIAVPLPLLAMLSFSQPSYAHDFWIDHSNYKAPTGEHCCGDNDCKMLEESDMQATPAGWFIRSMDETIPYSEAQTSEDGAFWRCKRSDGSRRCFFAPQPSS
jgi:hypothetical protein